MEFITVVVGLWFLAAMAMIIGFSLMFKAKPGVKAQYIAGNTGKQVGVLLGIVAAITMFDFMIDIRNVPLWNTIKMQIPAEGDQVGVLAKQWTWVFTHKTKAGNVTTEMFNDAGEYSDSANGAPKLHVRTGTKTIYSLNSEDVLHSFKINALRVTMDIIPGRTYKGWFEAVKPGTYDLACAEICGRGHGDMAGRLVVHTPDDYDKWVKAKGVTKADSAPKGVVVAHNAAH
ncbi:MAG: cytochrome c oxidase subunit II [Deltaproteobacteria bacterium]|nr:cytochrome c oxidase subunit II [Deltaproteobacteria bacterium]